MLAEPFDDSLPVLGAKVCAVEAVSSEQRAQLVRGIRVQCGKGIIVMAFWFPSQLASIAVPPFPSPFVR
jgi:hypothetical protein